MTMAQAGSLAVAHDSLLPQRPGGHGAGVVLSLLVHVGLILALTTAVDWHSSSSDVITAELWSTVPQESGAPPRPVPAPAPKPAPSPPPPPAPAPTPAPPPPPAPAPARSVQAPEPEPDIAIERAARRKAERDAAEQAKAARDKAQAKAQAEAERREQAQKAQAAQSARAEAARLEKQREQILARIMGEAGKAPGNPASGAQARNAGPSAAYGARLAALIRRNSRFAGTLPDNNPTEVEVVAGPGGTIISSRLIKSSGHPEWDEAVLRAIDRTGRFPPDEHGIVPSPMTIDFRPNDP